MARVTPLRSSGGRARRPEERLGRDLESARRRLARGEREDRGLGARRPRRRCRAVREPTFAEPRGADQREEAGLAVGEHRGKARCDRLDLGAPAEERQGAGRRERARAEGGELVGRGFGRGQDATHLVRQREPSPGLLGKPGLGAIHRCAEDRRRSAILPAERDGREVERCAGAVMLDQRAGRIEGGDGWSIGAHAREHGHIPAPPLPHEEAAPIGDDLHHWRRRASDVHHEEHHRLAAFSEELCARRISAAGGRRVLFASFGRAARGSACLGEQTAQGLRASGAAVGVLGEAGEDDLLERRRDLGERARPRRA
jgi:hypothetical protein